MCFGVAAVCAEGSSSGSVQPRDNKCWRGAMTGMSSPMSLKLLEQWAEQCTHICTHACAHKLQ
eukprot:5606600-Alexandrium_andersonii.AAC.1